MCLWLGHMPRLLHETCNKDAFYAGFWPFLPIPPYVSGKVQWLTSGYLRTLEVVPGNGR